MWLVCEEKSYSGYFCSSDKKLTFSLDPRWCLKKAKRLPYFPFTLRKRITYIFCSCTMHNNKTKRFCSFNVILRHSKLQELNQDPKLTSKPDPDPKKKKKTFSGSTTLLQGVARLHTVHIGIIRYTVSYVPS